MQINKIACIIVLFVVGCQARDAGVGPAQPTAVPPAEEPKSGRTAPGPAGEATIPPDPRKIAEMLRNRFGAAAVRAIRVEVEDDGSDVRVRLRGEVPSESIRDGVIREVAARVERLRFQDFDLIVSGPVPLLGVVPMQIDEAGPAFTRDLRYAAVPAPGIRSVRSTVEIWDLAAGVRINRLDTTGLEELKAVAFSRDGRTLATGHAHAQIVLWDMPLCRERRELVKPQEVLSGNDVGALAFAPDGRWLASVGAAKGEVWLWDLGPSRAARLLGTHEPDLQYLLAFSPDGRTLASADDRSDSITLWDVPSRTRSKALPIGSMHVEALAWSAEGRWLVVGRDVETQGVVLFDVATGRSRKLAPPDPGLVTGLACAPDGKTLATRHANLGVVLWDLATGKQWHRLDNSKVGSGETIAFSPDGGTLAVASKQREPWAKGPPGIQFWDVSGRPGAAPVAQTGPPPATGAASARDDLLEAEIAAQVGQRLGDPRIIRDFSAEVQPDGGVILRGTVNSAYFKEGLKRDVEIGFPIEDERGRRKRTIIDRLEVDPRIATER
jgi:hypothetical protein